MRQSQARGIHLDPAKEQQIQVYHSRSELLLRPYPPEVRLDGQKLFKKHLRFINRPNPRHCIYKVGLAGDADGRRTVKGGDRLDINPTVVIQLSERI